MADQDGRTRTGEAAGGAWQFWIDRGGTFTDIVARRPDGRFLTRKLLSEDPERYADPAVHGIREILGLAPDEPVPAGRVAAVKMGTTVATNALLERAGEPTVLVTTRGFADALRIGTQNRPRLFDRAIVLPEPLHAAVVEVDERVAADGRVLVPLDADAVRRALAARRAEGFRACAVVLMHGHAFPAHERAIAAIARDLGFEQVSASHEVSPLIKLVGRGDTTVVDAYLSPVLRRYVDRVAGALGGVPLRFMQSNGGLAAAERFRGRDAVLSGPAGGVVGMVETARQAGFGRIIGFDMGGTSTDVSHYAGELEREFDTVVAGVRMRAPMMSIHTVAAGGGSILSYDGGRFRVGPASAGAHPGPASYRRGGPPTVTDCNVVLGRVQPDFFPRVFGPGGDEPLDPEAARAVFRPIAEAAGLTVEETAAGFLAIAVDGMANAIKQISVRRGYDVASYALCCFGGAGGQHACMVADALGMSTVFIHPYAGVLSAFGMGLADMRAVRERSVEAVLSEEAMPAVRAALDALAAEADAALAEQGVADGARRVERTAMLRYEGTDTPLAVPAGTLAEMTAAFEARHRRLFGFAVPGRPLVVAAVVAEAAGGGEAVPAGVLDGDPPALTRPAAEAAMHDGTRRRTVPVFRREAMRPGDPVGGPALIVDPGSTTVVEPGWTAVRRDDGGLVLTRTGERPRTLAAGTEVDPIRLEIFNNLFMSVAEQMGGVLANTAQSVNIKERLDFSCAVFDAGGALVANAPHVPVHLGSMDESVKAVLRRFGDGLAPGDVFVLNDPYDGGTHLPDVTVVTPVFLEGRDRPDFFVASRGHHADIGGTTPGSMPPDSRTIAEEGVLLTVRRLVAAGTFDEDGIRDALASGPWPARSTDQNVADLKAQVAANERGAAELRRVAAEFGRETVLAYMGHVQDNAEEAVRRAVAGLSDGAFRYELDDGSAVQVAIRVDRAARSAVVDFSGTSPTHPGNFNAPLAICRAAVLYVFRTLVDGDIPMNAGCLRPLEIRVPEGSMLSPRPPAAVVAGNVEVSQVVVDALYGALGTMAASQGTMNNLTFGDGARQYYETICGGAGAGPGFDGASAVQTHMTNSRLTDPEVLETRYPVVVEEFAVRRGSGGAGRHRGGDGVVRRIRFEAPATVSILSNRRRVPPYGQAGGAPGATGETWLLRGDGAEAERLGSCASVEAAPGDRVEVRTPGGGGWGAA
jgi:5-oxoprolinase (ATP-hydrolysing)